MRDSVKSLQLYLDPYDQICPNLSILFRPRLDGT